MRAHLESTLDRIVPLADAAWQHAQHAAQKLIILAQHANRVAWQHAEPHLHPYTKAADRALNAACSGYHPWQIALAAVALALVMSRLLAWASQFKRNVRDRGVLQCVFDAVKQLPIISGIVKREQEKLVVRSMNR